MAVTPAAHRMEFRKQNLTPKSTKSHGRWLVTPVVILIERGISKPPCDSAAALFLSNGFEYLQYGFPPMVTHGCCI